MRARDAYALDYRPPGRRNGRVRRVLVAFFGVATMGEPIAPGGGEILIADAFTGRVTGTVPVSFGDDGFLRSRMDEDLMTMTADEFAAKYLPRLPDDPPGAG